MCVGHRGSGSADTRPDPAEIQSWRFMGTRINDCGLKHLHMRSESFAYQCSVTLEYFVSSSCQEYINGAAVATTAEWSKALDSGSRESGSIPVSVLLVVFFRTVHAEKYTHGQ